MEPALAPALQQGYHRTRASIHGLALDAAAGFPGLPAPATRWLLTQCANYAALHPGQHHLLAAVGVTADHAHTAQPRPEPQRRTRPGAPRPRPTTVSSSLDAGLPYARTYAHRHGGLGTAHYDVEHDGYPLGWWLYEQRKRANAHHRRTGQPWPHQTVMTALDPWWNPPWRISWQHTYTLIRQHHQQNQPLTRYHHRWLTTQHRTWHTLHPDQHTLLATISTTPKGRARMEYVAEGSP